MRLKPGAKIFVEKCSRIVGIATEFRIFSAECWKTQTKSSESQKTETFIQQKLWNQNMRLFERHDNKPIYSYDWPQM